MNEKNTKFSSGQLVFQELFVGTLIYIMVLGLLNDYASFVNTKSFSIIFFSSIVLEILTYLAFKLKSTIVTHLKRHQELVYKILTFFCVWLIMFFSKFIFIWVLDQIFNDYININGFFGILIVVLSVTIIHRLAYLIFKQLGQTKV